MIKLFCNMLIFLFRSFGITVKEALERILSKVAENIQSFSSDKERQQLRCRRVYLVPPLCNFKHYPGGMVVQCHCLRSLDSLPSSPSPHLFSSYSFGTTMEVQTQRILMSHMLMNGIPRMYNFLTLLL